MKKIIISAALIIAALNISKASAQNITLSYNAGYGTYAMSDMKDLLSTVKSALPVDGRIINNFPGYFNQTIQAGYFIKEHHFGLEYGLLSTGGKISYSDYSGFLNEEMNMKANKFGLFYQYHFYNQKINNNRLSFFASISPGVMFSKMDLEENIRLDIKIPASTGYSDVNFSSNGEAKFESTNFYVLPQLGTRFSFMKYFSVSLSAGYEIGINGKMESKSEQIGYGSTNFKMDWSGFRINAGITFLLPTKKIE